MVRKKLLIRRYVILLLTIFLVAVLSGLVKAAFHLGASFMVIIGANALMGAVLMSATFTSTAVILYQDSQRGFAKIVQVIQGWGWRQRMNTEQIATYQPPALLAVLMDNLQVSLPSPSTVRITGPEPIVSLLRAKLSKI